ncbi:MAG: type II CRISPR RNA-guided endonuclease Cas9 [Anaeroplasma bactoclasticum]|nr:type II CRISPR RNA-guided endonuclease Cas9 [Anaeroplasma bactoclasticum]
MGLILGLDLGVASVGYGIIEENSYEVIDYGVRLFEEGNADNNLKRRRMRGARRLKSRKKNRILAIKYYLKSLGLIDTIDFEILNNVYELRVKGLTQKLSNIELANVLINIAKHRGVSYEVAIDEDDKESKSASSSLTYNTECLKKKGKFICEFQLEKIKNGEKLRTKDNIFSSKDYEKELRKMLSNQKMSEEVTEKIVEIIMRRRDFSEGPGSEKFPTPYGSYRMINNQIQHINLIEEMRGKCSIFPEEPRIAKNSYTACLFNLLNDLNNITFVKDGLKTKFTTEEKEQIIKYVNEKGNITPKQLLKMFSIDENTVTGFRIDKNNKPLLSTFDIYAKFLKLGIQLDTKSFDLVIECLTSMVVIDKRVEELKKLNLKLSGEEIDKISQISKVNGYHSLSKKAMDLIIPELLDTSSNQMEIITRNNLSTNHLNFNGKKVPFDDTAILSPVAKRVHRQTINIVNELRKEYGEFASIVIETTRAKDSAEEKKEEVNRQKLQEENKTQTEQFLLDIGKNPEKINTKTKLKLVLYRQQNGKTMYSGEVINLDVLLNDPSSYEIEHIIPYSISFDNSLNNKALASLTENRDKGNKTPWEYFSSGMVKGPNNSWEKFEAYVNSLNIPLKKKANLLNQEDVSKFDNREGFINRNLNDTSYGIRTVMNTLKSYYKENNIATNVFTIKGKITHTFRNKVGLEKNRDVYIHHAIDALIIAGLKNQKIFKNAFELNTDKETGFVFNENSGEVIDFENPLEDSKLLKFIGNLKSINGTPQDFSYKVDTKTNRKFSDETIYSTRIYNDEEYVIKKYKDIYGKDGESVKKLFEKGKSSDLLVARNDEQTFKLLEKIVATYPNEKNPFAKYKEDHGFIRKYSKNGNGPVIQKLKYIGGKLGSYLDISSKYHNLKNKKVVLLQNTAYRTDIYQDKNGYYKFLTIRRFHIKQINHQNVIKDEIYQSLKKEKNITFEDKFLFSLNRNNIIRIVDDSDNYYRFITTNDDKNNVIEVKNIECKTEKRLMLSIGKKIKLIEKFNVSPTGKYQKVEKELLKLKW